MIAFVINVYQDAHLANRLGRQIGDFFPSEDVVFIGDGVTPFKDLDFRPGHSLMCFPRLKSTQSGAWTHRFLAIGLNTGADTIIKLDPDCQMWARPEIPKADWFGTLTRHDCPRAIHGGATGFSRGAAQALVDSKLLLEPSSYRYSRFGDYRWDHEPRVVDPMISLQDRILVDATMALGIKPVNWPDVNCWGNMHRSNFQRTPPPRSAAITHPHPTL